jgi:hypothetical protein
MSTGVGPQLTTTDIYVCSSFLVDFVRANLAQNGLQGDVTFTKNKSRDYNEKMYDGAVLCGQSALLSPMRLWVLFSMWLESSVPLMWKDLVNTLLKVVGFLWALRFPPTEKLTGWVRTILEVWGCRPAVIGYCCCGYPAYMWFIS